MPFVRAVEVVLALGGEQEERGELQVRDGVHRPAVAAVRGDEVFGHRITISYFRDQTKEEAEIEKRYADAAKEAKERELERLQAELGMVCYNAPGARKKLRIVA